MSELRINGGDIALDLVNTVEPRIEGHPPERDHLDSPEALLHWAARAGIVDPAMRDRIAAAWDSQPGAGQAAFADALQLRDAVATAADAARLASTGEARHAALASLTQRAADAISRSTLAPDPQGRHPARRTVGTEPASAIPDRLAIAAVELLQTADLSRLKACPPDAGGCGWLFIDTSRNNTRRWCSMEDCGSRAKSARLTRRRRSARHAS